MEEEGGVAYSRGSAVGNDTLALNRSPKPGGAAGSVDLVGRLKTLSSGRKKLMSKYFDVEEVENGPLLSEYFAVSLAFVALGAMIREANVRMVSKQNDNSDGVSPKLQRMVLDTMLKSAMERLRGLANRTQTLEEKVRDRSYMEAAFQFERLEFVKRITDLEATIAKYEATIAKNAEAEAVWRREKDDLVKRIADVDAQRGYFFKKMAEAEASLGDLQRLRMEDGKANAKLVEIYAGREQSWKSERVKLRHEIELLKGKLSKLQTQSQLKSPRSFDAAAEAVRMRNLKRIAKEIVREKVVSEREFAADFAVDQTPKSEVDSRSPKEFIVPGNDRKDSEGADAHELSAAQNQEMENELAIILKRVGALKKREASGGKLHELLIAAKDNDRYLESIAVNSNLAAQPTVLTEDEPDDGCWEEFTQEKLNTPENNIRELDSQEGFIQEKLNTPDDNISERTPEGSTVPDDGDASDSVAVNGKLTSDQTVEPLNLDEDWEQDFKDYSAICAEPASPDKIRGVSPAYDPVEHSIVDSLKLPEDDIKSEIIVSNPVSTSPTPDSDLIDMNDHTDELSRADISERQFDELSSDNGESSTVPSDGQNLQIAQVDLNNSTRQVSPALASLELKHQELSGGD